MKNNDVNSVELSTGKGLSREERANACRQYRAKVSLQLKELFDYNVSLNQASKILGESYKLLWKIAKEYDMVIPERYSNRCGLSRSHLQSYHYYYGEIPKGWDVHHIDGNHFNNTPTNLVALPHNVHIGVHSCKTRQGVETILREYLQVRGSASVPKEVRDIVRA